MQHRRSVKTLCQTVVLLCLGLDYYYFLKNKTLVLICQQTRLENGGLKWVCKLWFAPVMVSYNVWIDKSGLQLLQGFQRLAASASRDRSAEQMGAEKQLSIMVVCLGAQLVVWALNYGLVQT